MENSVNKILHFAVIAIFILTTSCAITSTKNYYYTYYDRGENTIIEDDGSTVNPVDTLTNNWNGQK